MENQIVELTQERLNEMQEKINVMVDIHSILSDAFITMNKSTCVNIVDIYMNKIINGVQYFKFLLENSFIDKNKTICQIEMEYKMIKYFSKLATRNKTNRRWVNIRKTQREFEKFTIHILKLIQTDCTVMDKEFNIEEIYEYWYSFGVYEDYCDHDLDDGRRREPCKQFDGLAGNPSNY
jgi:hypothetical protein